ncbi:DUF2695 domain-containing protein [Myroides sp. N17-2]|uniref:DUF2695 domain-containing protein n=1 Tax=Myroides sp. N17-2 TaxID=2030799 RepID=UPI000EFB716F|nr:DUF2695 domain-containing protein [Myroides sp. N17-2]
MNEKKLEKERKKELKQEWQQEQKLIFENSLPMSRVYFTQLFDDLDNYLEKCGCNHTNEKTMEILKSMDVKNIEEVLLWLREYGGYCDCEVLWNVEEHFE